jgi:hypothetical protein
MKEFERTSVRFFTFTQRRAADPGVLDHVRCHSAGSKRKSLASWPGREAVMDGAAGAVGTGTAVAVL